MAEDISITITADPNNAVTGIEKVRKATDELAASAKKANAAAAQGGADAVGQVITVSNTAIQSIGRTVSAAGNLGGELKQVTKAASGITAALGDSVPIIGQIGSALSSVVSGPLGIISAAIGAATFAIKKLIDEAEARVARIKASADAVTSAATDKLMQGRKDYQAQLDVLERVKELNALAKQSELTAKEIRDLRSLTSQLGIRDKDVTARGVNPYALEEVESALRRSRKGSAERDFKEFELAWRSSFKNAVEKSDLSDESKKLLSGKSIQEQMEIIQRKATFGLGSSAEEIKAYQSLYGMVKNFEDVRSSYGRDPLLGRSQAELDAAAVGRVKSGVAGRLQSEAEWQEFQDRIDAEQRKVLDAEQRAAKTAADEAKRKQDAADKITKGLENELAAQQLISDGKQREAYLLRQRINMESALGRVLTSDELANLENLAGSIYDLQHPQAQELSTQPEVASVRSARRAAASSVNLDRLQRIGANITRPAVSAEKLVMDRQLSTQESIKVTVQTIAASIARGNPMRF